MDNIKIKDQNGVQPSTVLGGQNERLVMPRWCPTQGGTFTAYDPEYLDGDEWREVPTVRGTNGFPAPRRNGGITSTIGLFGHAQAQALAWGYAALAAGEGEEVKVRVQPYEVVYDIKARKKEA